MVNVDIKDFKTGDRVRVFKSWDRGQHLDRTGVITDMHSPHSVHVLLDKDVSPKSFGRFCDWFDHEEGPW